MNQTQTSTERTEAALWQEAASQYLRGLASSASKDAPEDRALQAAKAATALVAHFQHWQQSR